jgi:uncharacterized protein (TIGR03083 family)
MHRPRTGSGCHTAAMELERHLDGVRESLEAFASHATAAGLDAMVPTTPDWDVRRLVAHQGLVHRWATATILGRHIDDEATEREGMEAPDPVGWLREGGQALLRTIEAAPGDLTALVFLADAPSPREFWARRQCHETTIHAVDALAAHLGRHPLASDTWIEPDLALDGIDELLTGFMTRPTSKLRSDQPLSLSIRPNDVQRSWLVGVSDEPPVIERGAGRQRRWGRDDADMTLEGTGEQLYLALWNRSDEVTGEGYDLWRRTAQVSWS